MYEELTSEFASPDVLVREGVHNPPPACFVDLFRHVSDNRTFYEAMLTSEGGHPFAEQLEAYLIERSLARLEAVREGLDEPLPMPAELVAYFVAGGIVHAVQWWVQEDFPLSPEEMARHVMRLIAEGTFSLFEGR